MIQSQMVAPPLAAIDGTTLRLKTATTKRRTRSRRPRARIRWGWADWGDVDKEIRTTAAKAAFLKNLEIAALKRCATQMQHESSFARRTTEARLSPHEHCLMHRSCRCCAERARAPAPHAQQISAQQRPVLRVLVALSQAKLRCRRKPRDACRCQPRCVEQKSSTAHPTSRAAASHRG